MKKFDLDAELQNKLQADIELKQDIESTFGYMHERTLDKILGYVVTSVAGFIMLNMKLEVLFSNYMKMPENVNIPSTLGGRLMYSFEAKGLLMFFVLGAFILGGIMLHNRIKAGKTVIMYSLVVTVMMLLLSELARGDKADVAGMIVPYICVIAGIQGIYYFKNKWIPRIMILAAALVSVINIKMIFSFFAQIPSDRYMLDFKYFMIPIAGVILIEAFNVIKDAVPFDMLKKNE